MFGCCGINKNKYHLIIGNVNNLEIILHKFHIKCIYIDNPKDISKILNKYKIKFVWLCIKSNKYIKIIKYFHHKHIPVICITNNDDYVHDALKAGAVRIIHQPLSTNNIAILIKKYQT